MRISHVGVFSAKTHEFTTIEELEESKVQDSASSCTHKVSYNDDKDDQHNQHRTRNRNALYAQQ